MQPCWVCWPRRRSTPERAWHRSGGPAGGARSCRGLSGAGGIELEGCATGQDENDQRGRRDGPFRHQGARRRPARIRCAPVAAAGAQSDRFLPVDHLPAPHRTVPARPRPCRRAQLERLETDLQRMLWDEFGGELQVALGWAATPADARAPLERRAAMRWRIMRICSRSR